MEMPAYIQWTLIKSLMLPSLKYRGLNLDWIVNYLESLFLYYHLKKNSDT